MSPGSRRLALVGTEAVCLLLVAIALAPCLRGRSVYTQDVLLYVLPHLQGLQEELLAGRLRVWDLDLFAGYHALAAGQSGSLYPFNWLLLGLCSPWLALGVGLACHLWLLARGTVGLALELGGSRRAALLAASALTLSGSVGNHLVHYNVIVALGWLAVQLWLAARVARRPRGWSGLLLLAGAYGLGALQSHPQWAFYQALAIGTLTLAVVPDARDRLRAGGRALGAIVGAAPLAAGWLLPGISYHRLFPRPQPGGLTFAIAGGLRGVEFPAALLAAPPPDPPEVFFPGALCWTLALLGLCRGERTALRRAGLALAAVGAFVALGQLNPLYGVLGRLPPFSLFRFPARAALLLELGLVLLAADAVGPLLRGAIPFAARRATLGLGLGLLAAAALARLGGGDPLLTPSLFLAPAVLVLVTGATGARRRPFLGGALALGLLELALAFHALNPTEPVALLRAPPPLAAPIAASDNPRTVDLAAHEGLPWLEARRRLRRNSGVLYGVQYLTGYESAPPLGQEVLTRDLYAVRDDPGELVLRCSLTSVRWIVTDAPLADPRLRLAGADAGAYLYENLDALPLAYAVSPGGAITPARLRAHAPDHLEVQVTLDQPGWLVCAYAWYPGWTAQVDDAEEVPVGLELSLFMRVELPPGEHTVDLRFEDPWVDLGLRVQAGAWALWLGALALLALRRRR